MDSEDEVIVALLHDVVEDTSVSFEMLESDFSSNIIDALKLLTHDEDIPYMDYIKNIKSNDIARKVKLADLRHNSDKTRLPKITDEDLKRYEKYKKAIEYLS